MKKADPKKLLREARKALAMPGGSQQELLKRAKKTLALNNAELAALLDGRSEAAVKSWLAPEGTAKHRRMPDDIRRLLSETLARAKG